MIDDQPNLFVIINEVRHITVLSISTGYCENKKMKDWRGVTLEKESEIGQLLHYLLGVHARRLQISDVRRPKSVLGMYMDGNKVHVFICKCR